MAHSYEADYPNPIAIQFGEAIEDILQHFEGQRITSALVASVVELVETTEVALIGISEAARALGITDTTLYEMIEMGEIGVVAKLLATHVLSESDVEALARERLAFPHKPGRPKKIT